MIDMIIFLYGEDTFRSREHLKKMIDKFKADRDPSGINVVCVDAMAEKDGWRIMRDAVAIPFLSERRMIVIESLLSSKHNEIQKEFCDRLLNKKLPESNVILFWEGASSWKSKEAKALGEILIAEKYSQEFQPLSGVKLIQWIHDEARKLGGLISSEVANYLSAHGKDSWHIHGLVEQLIAYRKGDAIQLADAKLFLNENADDNIFNLADAIIAGRAGDAFGMIQEQYRVGEDVQYIFAMVLRQCRIMLEMRDLCDRTDKISSDEIAKNLSLHPFVVKKTLPIIRRYSMQELRRMHDSLLNFDIAIKTGLAKPETLLDLYVGREAMKTPVTSSQR